MADFTESNNVKTAIRNLAAPIADATAFNAIVQSVVVGNPFGCVGYMTGGVSHDPVEKTKETYTAKIMYQDTSAKIVGSLTDKYSTLAGFNAGIAAILASTGITAAHGGQPARDTEGELYTATLKCHDPNGELYYVVLNRDKVTLNSYNDEAIRTKVETWADTETALA
jgi:hypothetical protein